MAAGRAIVGVIVATAIASCAHAPPAVTVRADRRWDSSCLIQRGGCPAAKAPNACPSQLNAVAFADVLRGAAGVEGESIVVRGPLQRTGGMCTLLGCYKAETVATRAGGFAYRYRAPAPGKPWGMATLDDESFAGDRVEFAERGCCNRCGAALALGGELWLTGAQLGCGGDESLICCSLDARGQDVVARGVLRRYGNTLALEDATVCAP